MVAASESVLHEADDLSEAHGPPVGRCSTPPPPRRRKDLTHPTPPSSTTHANGHQPALVNHSKRVVAAAEGHAAKRGGLGARSWADIRLAARLACEQGVIVKLHGVEVHPILCTDRKASLSSAKENGGQVSKHAGISGQQPTEAAGHATARPSRAQQRSAERLLQFQEKKRAAAWLSLSQRILHRARAKLRDDVWTSWMRSRAAPSAPPAPPTVIATPVVIAPAPDTPVRLSGLQSRPELNGHVGTTGAFDEAKGRCAVRLSSGESVALKPSNLEVLPGHLLAQKASMPSSPGMADAWRASLDALLPEPGAGSSKASKRRSRKAYFKAKEAREQGVLV